MLATKETFLQFQEECGTGCMENESNRAINENALGYFLQDGGKINAGDKKRMLVTIPGRIRY